MNSNQLSPFTKPGSVLPLRRVGRIVYLILVSLILFSLPVQAQAPPEVTTWYNYPASVTRSGYWYAELNIPFVAVDDSMWETYKHHPVYGSINGVPIRAIVLDTGYLSRYCVMQRNGECYSIALDMSKETYYGLGLVDQSAVIDWWDVDMSVWWGKL